MKNKQNIKLSKYLIFIIIFILLFLLIFINFSKNNVSTLNETIVNTNLDIKKLEYKNNFNLEATKSFLNYDNKKIKVFAYNNLLPGPTIKGKIGDRIVINFTNKLNEKTSIHWHGLQIENKMDGVPGLTQEPINPNENFIYNYTLENPGIYWYHPHFDSFKQVDMGLYGAIIVDDENTSLIKSDKDEIIFLDDFRLLGDEISTNANMHDIFMKGKYGNSYLINGKKQYNLKVQNYDIVRLRLINPSNARIYNFGIEDTNFLVIGHDIGLIEKPYLSKFITIAPGERYDVLVYINSSKKKLEVRNYNSQNSFDKL